MGTLIDTSLLIHTERDGRWFDIDEEDVAISSITASELLHGVHRAVTVEQRTRREAFVTRVLLVLSIVAFDADVARVHARVWAELSASRNNPGSHDFADRRYRPHLRLVRSHWQPKRLPACTGVAGTDAIL